MTPRSTTNEVLVIIGVGGMGLSIARRVGAGRTIVLADISAAGLETAAEALTSDGHRVLTREVDVTSPQFGGRRREVGRRDRACHGCCSYRGTFAATGIR